MQELPVEVVNSRTVFCDGGPTPDLGHPRVYINLVNILFLEYKIEWLELCLKLKNGSSDLLSSLFYIIF